MSIAELANTANAIYVARAIAISPDGDTASFRVVRVIKGTVPDQVVESPLTQEFTINSCDFGASLFLTVRAVVNSDHILYVVNGQVQRGVPRAGADSSFHEEIKLITRALPPNTSLERTRGR